MTGSSTRRAADAGSANDPLLPALPRHVQFEVTGACNLRCRMCLVRYQPPINKIQGSLPFELFRRVVDAIPGLRKITLQGLGEPLLAPDLFAMIEYVKPRGIRMGFNTNATLLTRDRAERLVDGQLSWLHFSLDGATASTFEGVRDGASFDRVRRNIEGLVEVMRERGTRTPRLELVFVAMRRNVHELADVVRLAGAWGIGKVWVQNLSHSFSDTEPAGRFSEIRSFAAAEALWNGNGHGDGGAARAFAEARHAAEEVGVTLRLPEREEGAGPRQEGEPGCWWPFGETYITHDGKVLPCCMVMGPERATLGDLNVEDFPSIWHGPAYRDFRRALLSARPPEVCEGCSLYRGVF
ncbi:MAG TPA: radical SAM protein [Actinomycetota bacterium]|nr:radical SAM protein [Actinomycetota bacterium]